MGFFGPSIEYRLEQANDRDLHGALDDGDFDSARSLKRHVAALFKNFECPSCGNHRVSGSGVIVTYGKVHLFRQKAVRGWLGGTKQKDERYKTVWRIHDITLQNAPGRALLNFFALLDPPPGELECQARGCGWKTKGERGGTISLGEFWQTIANS